MLIGQNFKYATSKLYEYIIQIFCLSFTICPPLNLYHLFYICLKRAHNTEAPQSTLKNFKGEVKLFNNSQKREILEKNGTV